MKSENYFLLFENCKAVKGISRSIICDLQLGTYIFIPNSLVDLVEDMKKYTLEKIIQKYHKDGLTKELLEEYIQFFEENEMGHYTDNPNSFPEIPMILDSPYLIHDCILEWSELNEINFPAIVAILLQTGCNQLEIRCYDSPKLEAIKKAIENLKYTKIRNCILYVQYNEKDKNKYLSFLCDLPIIGQMIIHNSEKEISMQESDKRLLFYEKHIDGQNCCGNVGMDFTVNLRHFIESNKFNPCLNKKFSIDKNGNIKNCPSMNTLFGNYLSDDVLNILKQEKFQEVWNIKKDEIETCKTCEFRYICGDCRAFMDSNFSKPTKCTYNPKTMNYE